MFWTRRQHAVRLAKGSAFFITQKLCTCVRSSLLCPMGALLSGSQSRRAYRQRVSAPLRLGPVAAEEEGNEEADTQRPGFADAASFLKRARKRQKKNGGDKKKKGGVTTRVVSPLRTEKPPPPKGALPPPGPPSKPKGAAPASAKAPVVPPVAPPEAPPVAPALQVTSPLAVVSSPPAPVEQPGSVLLSAAEVKALTETCTCSICEDYFVAPCTTVCGHAFCRKCLVKWIRTQFRTRSSVTKPPVCPMCRAPLLPDDDEDDDEEDVFQVNRALESLVKVLKAHQATGAGSGAAAAGGGCGEPPP